jgi:opacity protein-like surface antigen
VNRLASVVVAIIIVLVSSPAAAQVPAPSADMSLTVSVPTAAVRMGPSVASPLVGEARRGAVLEVTRDIGAWVKVTWPDAPDGVGYVHQSMGTLSNRPTREQRIAEAVASLPPPELPATTSTTDASAQVPLTNDMLMRTVYVPPPTHLVGFGGQVAAKTPGFGFSSRIWSRSRLGVQIDLSRSKLTNDLSADRVRSTEFVPSVIYSISDYVSESFWLRPYVGGGVAMIRSKLYGGVPEVAVSESANKFGYRAFGGAELTVPGVPRLAVSVDFGYQWAEKMFDSFDPAGPRFSVSGHWYVK